MPLTIPADHPSLFIRKEAFERAGLTRQAFDERLGLTDEEFRVEGALVVIGPIHDTDALPLVIEEMEQLGLTYFDDFFDLSGTWPAWLRLFVMGS